MSYPFTAEQFTEILHQYNSAVWPMQAVIYLMAACLLYFIFKPSKYSNKIVAFILAALWLWMGIAYHLVFFADINPAAKYFGAMFILQGLLYLVAGVFTGKMAFMFNKKWPAMAGLGLVILGPIIYPILSHLLGHQYPRTPSFGLPCPTTIFTFGVLLMSVKMPRYLTVIPFIWSIIGFFAAYSFGIREDVLLLVSGVVTTGIIMFKHRIEAVPA